LSYRMIFLSRASCCAVGEGSENDFQISHAKNQRQAASDSGAMLIEKMMSLQPPVSVDINKSDHLEEGE
jgi:hypothetical protein